MSRNYKLCLRIFTAFQYRWGGYNHLCNKLPVEMHKNSVIHQKNKNKNVKNLLVRMSQIKKNLS